MHYYEYHHKSGETGEKARVKYPWLFEMNYSDESREVRYYLLEYLSKEYGYNGMLEKDKNGKPIPLVFGNKILFWSVSHSENYVAFIISDQLTGIDLAEYKVRDDSLLDIHGDQDYEILGGKNWENFYRLWTAKEAIIKGAGDSLDDMRNISLVSNGADGIFVFEFREKFFRIQTFIEKSVIISYFV